MPPHPPQRGTPPQRPREESQSTEDEIEDALDFALSIDVLLEYDDGSVIKYPALKGGVFCSPVVVTLRRLIPF